MTRRDALRLAAGLMAWPAAAWPHEGSHQAVVRTRAGWPVMPFTLTDQHGRPFTQEQLADHWTFVLFGDRGCRTRCDAALAALVGVQRRIARTEAVKSMQVLFVALAPAPEPDRLRAWLAGHDPHFVGATGPQATLAALLDDLRTERGAPGPGTLLLIGPDASRRAEYLPPYDVPWLTAAFLKARVGH
jgi:protein SCO1/2